MPAMKWTDEAIENGLQYCRRFDQAGQSDNTSQQLKRALLELKRVRAWARCGLDDCTTLTAILNGDPAPTDEQEETK